MKVRTIVKGVWQWLGFFSRASTNQLAFDVLEIGDILTLGTRDKLLGAIRVIGVPTESDRVLGVIQKEPVQSWPVPAKERKTYYTFRNIDAPFKGGDGFIALYTGTSVVFCDSGYTYIFPIAEIKREDGKARKARFKQIKPRWARFRDLRFSESVRIAKAKRV